MRNKLIVLLLAGIAIPVTIFADTTSVASDSATLPFVPPNQGPLGIDNTTGVALYGAAILFAVLVLLLWRKNISTRRNKS